MLRLLGLALLRLLRLHEVVLQRLVLLLHYCITTCKAEIDSLGLAVIWCKASTTTSSGFSAELVQTKTAHYVLHKWLMLRMPLLHGLRDS